jgi:HTH-type transcriptional regulator, osmoprotectant uptake regulator
MHGFVASGRADKNSEQVEQARVAMLEGVGQELAASFPGITRLGGQIVAALYLEGRALSMDELVVQIGRAKSNVFSNLRALLSAGIVERQRPSGARHDVFALRGPYPDVIVGAYLARLRRVVKDKCTLCRRSLALLGNAKGPDADRLRARMTELLEKYERFDALYTAMAPGFDGAVDVEAVFGALAPSTLEDIARVARTVLGNAT